MSRWEAPGEVGGEQVEDVCSLAALLPGHEVQWLISSMKDHSSCHTASGRATVTAWLPVTTTFPCPFRPMNY